MTALLCLFFFGMSGRRTQHNLILADQMISATISHLPGHWVLSSLCLQIRSTNDTLSFTVKTCCYIHTLKQIILIEIYSAAVNTYFVAAEESEKYRGKKLNQE